MSSGSTFRLILDLKIKTAESPYDATISHISPARAEIDKFLSQCPQIEPVILALEQAVTRPASFFETEARDPSLVRPAVVVGLVAVAGLLNSIPTVLAVADALSPEAGLIATFGFAIGSITTVVGPFVSWVIVVTILFAGSVLADGDGAFQDCLPSLYGDLPHASSCRLSVGSCRSSFSPAWISPTHNRPVGSARWRQRGQSVS